MPSSLTDTGVVPITKLTEVAPFRTFTDAGVLAAASVSVTVMVNPPAGAGAESVAVPVRVLQPATTASESERLLS